MGFPPSDSALALEEAIQEKAGSRSHDNNPTLQIQRKRQAVAKRILLARLGVFTLAVCSLVLFGVQFPKLLQRISCHNGRILGHEVDVVMETEAGASSLGPGGWESERGAMDDVGHANTPLAASILQLAKRQANSSSVAPPSSSSPEPPSSTPISREPPNSSPSSSVDPPSSPSPDPPSSPSPSPSPPPPPPKSSTISTTPATPTTPTTTPSRNPPSVSSPKPPSPVSTPPPVATSTDEDPVPIPTRTTTVRCRSRTR
ncbi:hypothetical protein B0H66DRAFT_141650 [Apodospora peruviana]|uniref:Uncharacterized protein n=1 Tax=Apodospora peruviana TaxID=516989 RepID=A0AAE0IIU5_9PEZI|nr:hypothetical protein B0H66DRAFT_141650 [Apodospora peruviana]